MAIESYRSRSMSAASLSVRSDIPLILIADDDRSMRTLLDLAVTEQGYRATSAKDGEQCLSEYDRQQPDMVLLDAVMPQMDGFECCQRLRQMPGGDRTPILMITVLDDRESVDRAFEAGATDYITKPIHWAVLSQRVRYLLAASAAGTRSPSDGLGEPESRRWEAFFGRMAATIARRVESSADTGKQLEVLLSEVRGELQNLSSVERVAIAPITDLKPISIELAEVAPLGTLSAAELALFFQYETQYRQGEAIALNDLTELPRSNLSKSARSALMVPMIIGDRLWGVLCCHYCTQSHAWDAVEIDRFSHLANLLAIGIK